jgi:hypothetical protein
MLSGSTHISYSNAHLPLTLSPSSTVHPTRSTLVGTLYFLTSTVSIILGLEYLVYISLALVLLVVCMQYNTSVTSSIVVYNEEKMCKDKYIYKYMDYIPIYQYLKNRYGSTSTSGIMENRQVFNHLISLSCDVHGTTTGTSNISNGSTSTNTSTNGPLTNATSIGINNLKPPTLHLDVYQYNSSTSIVEHVGYVETSLTVRAGGFNVDLTTTSTASTTSAEMHKFFLGACQKHPASTSGSNISKTSSSTSSMNRFGMLTKNSGVIRLRGQCIVTHPVTSSAPDSNTTSNKIGADNKVRASSSSTSSKKAVDDILKSFRQSKEVAGGATSSTSSKKDLLQRALRPVNISRQPGGATSTSTSTSNVLQSIRAKRANADNTTTGSTSSVLANIRARREQSSSSGSAGTSSAGEAKVNARNPTMPSSSASNSSSSTPAPMDMSQLMSRLQVAEETGKRNREERRRKRDEEGTSTNEEASEDSPLLHK